MDNFLYFMDNFVTALAFYCLCVIMIKGEPFALPKIR